MTAVQMDSIIVEKGVDLNYSRYFNRKFFVLKWLAKVGWNVTQCESLVCYIFSTIPQKFNVFFLRKWVGSDVSIWLHPTVRWFSLYHTMNCSFNTRFSLIHRIVFQSEAIHTFWLLVTQVLEKVRLTKHCFVCIVRSITFFKLLNTWSVKRDVAFGYKFHSIACSIGCKHEARDM